MSDVRGTAFAAAVVVAAGKGERFGQGGKVLAEAGGRPLLAWSLDALAGAVTVRDVVIVAGMHTERAIADLVATGRWSNVSRIVRGGATRHQSVVAGVSAVADDIDVVLIHDAARPLVASGQFDACAELARETGAAILAAPVADTLKRVRNGAIEATVSRADLWGAQTPQGFRLVEYRRALDAVSGVDAEFTDDASIYEYLGQPVAILPGTSHNIKVTQPGDLLLVDLLLRHSKGNVHS
jgi:2-C-methyl-D-erythritol 4-phosphate cytidylyltransferase